MKSLIFFLIGFFFIAPVFSFADTTGIGTDPLTLENYGCVAAATKKKSKIQIESPSKGTLRIFSKRKAIAKTKRSLNQAKKRRNAARKSLAQQNKKLQRLLGKLIITAEVVAETEATQAQIATLTTRIGELDGHIAIIAELKKSINRCGEKNEIAGNFRLVSGTFAASNKKIFFYTYYIYVIDTWDEQFSRICVFDHKLGRERVVTPFSPNRCIVQDPVEGVDTCFAHPQNLFDGRWYVQVDGRAGYQEPGTCDPKPWMCSLSEAQAHLNAALNGVSFSFIGFLKNGEDCDDL
ncbi:MAG: hypothetical protein KDD55_10140 [Bdellovibrionales bacterium]|nr:hypothetical protein [Bdellovibrionales bacterium]